MSSGQPTVRLLLDEMHAPVVARTLRERGVDVLSVAEEPSLRAMTDEEVFAWAAGEGRRIVTENVKDFRRILVRSQESGQPVAALLLTTSETFPRSRRNLGPLIAALDAWMRDPDAAERPTEDWLRPAPG